MAQPYPAQPVSSSQPYSNPPLSPQGQSQSQNYPQPTPPPPHLPPIPAAAFQGMPYPAYPQNRSPIGGPAPHNTIPMQPAQPLPPGSMPQAYYYQPLNVPWTPNAPYPPQYYPVPPYYPQQTQMRNNNPPMGRKRLNDSYNNSSPRSNAHQRLANGRSPRGSPRSHKESQPLQNGTFAPDPHVSEGKVEETQDVSASSSTTASGGINDTPLTSHSPRSSVTSTLSSPQPKTASVITEQWCISANIVEPSIAHNLTISPQAKPPSHIFDRAVSVDLSPPKLIRRTRRRTPAEVTEVVIAGLEEEISHDVFDAVGVSDGPPLETRSDSSDEHEAEVPIKSDAAPVAEVTATWDLQPAVPDLGDDAENVTKTSPRGPPKSWASLLRSETSGSQSSPNDGAPNTLPTSSVVGYSVPANEPSEAPIPNASAIMSLLMSRTRLKEGSPLRIQPRGLINTGNMCFANTILQVLVFTEPYWRLFEELLKLCPMPLKTRHGCPLLNATMQFMKEFAVASPTQAFPPGKPQKTAAEDEVKEPFIPQVVYEALKEKKRFDSMRGGQQEDAEEFLGFYLDTIEEELSELMHAIDPDRIPKTSTVYEHEEDEQPEGGWTEVGKHNRKVVTRTVRSVDTYISLIFGGRGRSAVRRPGSSDTVNVELWRHLGLDIQATGISTIEDALCELSRPETVQVASSAGGALVDASKQYVVDMLPPILVLHMKRFHYDPVLKDVVKQKKVIRFGAELVLPKECMSSSLKSQPPSKYKLYGVLYHHGLYATGGHYTLDVLHPSRTPEAWGKGWKEGWIRIDDEIISEIQTHDVLGQRDADDRTVYLLFYRRIG